MTVTQLVVGPSRHGVVSFAMNLAEALQSRDRPIAVVRVADSANLDDAIARVEWGQGVHLNFTDRLFGTSPSAAARRVLALVEHFEAKGAKVSATLHDVPQLVDGGNYVQRVSAYRIVCAALHGRATNSDHERSLLSEAGIAAPADVVVVPLPLDLYHAPPRRPNSGGPSVAVLGFIYPGKGHAEVLAAMAGLQSTVEFLAIGECSAGHDDLERRLVESARHAGRKFAVTGYVPFTKLTEMLHQVTVPVANHRHVSASGSINSWITAHRRPIAPEESLYRRTLPAPSWNFAVVPRHTARSK